MDDVRICDQCSKEFIPKERRIRKPGCGRFCSRQCAGLSQRRQDNHDGTSPYRILARQGGHPLAFRGGQVLEHRKVLFDSIGPGTHPCHWCEVPVTWQVKAYNRRGNLVVDHVDGNRFNNDLLNLVPACGFCNLTRSMKKIVRDDEIFLVRADGRRARATERTCVGCEIQFLIETRSLKSGRPNIGTFCTRVCKNKNIEKLRARKLGASSGN